jgi:hypothetical protein
MAQTVLQAIHQTQGELRVGRGNRATTKKSEMMCVRL